MLTLLPHHQPPCEISFSPGQQRAAAVGLPRVVSECASPPGPGSSPAGWLESGNTCSEKPRTAKSLALPTSPASSGDVSHYLLPKLSQLHFKMSQCFRPTSFTGGALSKSRCFRANYLISRQNFSWLIHISFFMCHLFSITGGFPSQPPICSAKGA